MTDEDTRLVFQFTNGQTQRSEDMQKAFEKELTKIVEEQYEKLMSEHKND